MRTSDVCPTCSTFTNALCSIYNGAFLVTLDINTLDSVEEALIKIEAYALSGPVAGLQDLTSVLTTGNTASDSITLSSTTAQSLTVTNITSGDVGTYSSTNASWGDVSNQLSSIYPDRLYYQKDAGGFSTTISYVVPTATHAILVQAGSGTLAFTSDIVTNLTEGTTTTTTVDVDSSNGTNATLVAATTVRAGVMTSAKFDEVVLNNAKVGFLNLTGHITSTGAATLLGSFTLAQLDTAMSTTGTADATTFLRGDNAWTSLDRAIVDDTTTSYGFVLADANNEVTLNNAGAITAILPANGSIPIPVGSSIKVINKGAGVVTLSVTTDTINTDTGGLTMAQYAVRTLYKIAATEWIVGF